MAEHVDVKRRSSTAALYRDILERIVVPAIGTMKANRIERSDVAKLHLKWKRTPYQANRVVAVVGSMFSFARKRSLVSDSLNPTRGIERYHEDGRERFLSTDELVRLGAAIRQAQTQGIAWDVDEAKPTSKHVPKRKRRTVIVPTPRQRSGCYYSPAAGSVKSWD